MAYSEEQFSVLATPDSFDGPNAPEPQLPSRPVDCVDVLKQLGAAPGKYVVQIVSEWCDEGTLHAAVRKGVFRAQPQHRRSRTWALRALLRTAREVRHCYALRRAAAMGLCDVWASNLHRAYCDPLLCASASPPGQVALGMCHLHSLNIIHGEVHS